ncbi:hypothetical protein C9374_014729 [Naegleria lovaniensis]|uniref:Guanylate cyclase domain-containing protein n=1 Tax=Naegleria lovaniensis TaxID=51637 RepID=A0AA88GE25_NAELO|nr:uncharacterized protein C9374_014729 [Naegleria lovaniensis]KAG2370627.1 hypothetical protein C9374_014729 [Naegleria lovaniensis]
MAKQTLPANSWSNESYYEQALSVNLLYAECEYVSGNHSSAVEVYQNILPNIVDTVDRLKVRFLLLKSASASSKYETMYDEFVDLLASNPSTHCLVANGDSFTEKWIESATNQIKDVLQNFADMSEILEMKECADEEAIAFARCILECVQGVYIGKNSNKIFLFVTPLLLFKTMIEDGLYADLTHTILVSLGWQLAYLDEPKLGCDLAQVGIKSARENHAAEPNYALTKFFEICITACKDGLQEVLRVSEEAFKASEQIEEISWGAQSGAWLALSCILLGLDRDTTNNYLEEVKTFNRKYSKEFESDLVTCLEHIPNILYGEVESFSPSFLLEGIEETTYSRLIIYFTKALIHFVKDELQEAAEQIHEADDVIDDAFGTPFYLLYKWFSILILTSFYEKYDDISATKGNQKKSKLSIMEVMLGPNAKAPKTMKEKTLERIFEHEKDVIDLYAKYPVFMEAAMGLTSAEIAKLNGVDSLQVIQLYTSASEIAQRQNLHFYTALIQTRLVDFCLTHQTDSRILRNYFEDALKTWNYCGASLMVNKLSEQYQIVFSQRHSDAHSLHPQDSFMSFIPPDSIELSNVFSQQATHLLEFTNADRVCVILKEPNSSDFKLVCEKEQNNETEVFEDLLLVDASYKLCVTAAKLAIKSRNALTISNMQGYELTLNQLASSCEYLQQNEIVKELMVIPLSCDTLVRGAIMLEASNEGTFTKALTRSTKLMLDLLMDGLSKQVDQLKTLLKFTPTNSLTQIGKDFRTLELGDSAMKRSTVVCVEVRNFSDLMESFSVPETLSFINSFIGQLTPVVENNGGFVERSHHGKHVIVFPEAPKKALQAVTEIVKVVRQFNKDFSVGNGKKVPISIGIGVHVGSCVFGLVGTEARFGTTLFSETVSKCSHISKASNTLGVIICTTKDLLDACNLTEVHLQSRKLGKFLLKNKKNPVPLFELYANDWVEYSSETSKQAMKQLDECMDLFAKKNFDKVLSVIQTLEKTIKEKFDSSQPSILGSVPHIKLLQIYRDQCTMLKTKQSSPSRDWAGEIALDQSFQPKIEVEHTVSTPKTNEINEEYERKLRSLQSQLEQVKMENENLRSNLNTESGMGCFCVPSKKKVHPAHDQQ